ncbi:MAG: hypothetical protein ACRCTA_07810, partial [Bacilli bacterium]
LYPGKYYGTHDYPSRVWGAMMNFIANGNEYSFLDLEKPPGLILGAYNSSKYRNSGITQAGYGHYYVDMLPSSSASFFDYYC